MNYLLILCLFTVISCSKKSESSSEIDGSSSSETPAPEAVSKYRSTEEYIFDVGMAHLLEHKLKGYKLKAAIVNSFNPVLFYYNEELQLVYFYFHESLGRPERDSLILKIDGQKNISRIEFFLTEQKENSKVVAVKGDEMTQEEYKDFIGPGIPIGYGFKLKQTDILQFSITLKGGQQGLRQDVEINYDPNNGWRSHASEISSEFDEIIANVFLFGKEKMIDQMKRVTKEKQYCIVRYRPHPYNSFTMKLELDNNYEAFNKYSVEIEVKEKQIIVNNKTGMGYILDMIKINDDNLTDVRITLSETSDDQTVRELLEFLISRYVTAEYSIGFK